MGPQEAKDHYQREGYMFVKKKERRIAGDFSPAQSVALHHEHGDAQARNVDYEESVRLLEKYGTPSARQRTLEITAQTHFIEA